MDSMTVPPGSEPFGETADTRFFWCGEARSAPMAQIEAAIAGGTVAVACAGAAGSGKTALLYKLADHLSASGAGFLHPDRVVRCGARASASSAPPAWEGAKGTALAAGKTADVLLLDDVDQLTRAEMAELREWWSILREKREQVALVVSCAATAVDPQGASRRQDLCTMLDTVVTLPPLTAADIEEVIGHRLQVAGLAIEDMFTQSASEKVAFYAKGTPKRVVEICNRAMSLAEENDSFPIESDLVKEAAHQIYLPSHLREFSRKISMGLGPVPASLGGSGAASSPSPPTASAPAVETRYERRAYVEPRPSVEVGPPAALSAQVGTPRSREPEKGERTIPLKTGTSPRPGRLDEPVPLDPAATEAGPAAVAPPFPPPAAKPPRRRGGAGVVAICGIAVVMGAVGYLAGQGDIEPVEVVRIIPDVETIDSVGAGNAAPSPAVSDTGNAPAPAPEGVERELESAVPAGNSAEPPAAATDPTPEPAAPKPAAREPAAPEPVAPEPAASEPAAPAPVAPAPIAPEPREVEDVVRPPISAEDDAELAAQAEEAEEADEGLLSGDPIADPPAAPRDEIAELLSRPDIAAIVEEDESTDSAAGGTTDGDPAGAGTTAEAAQPGAQAPTSRLPSAREEEQLAARMMGDGAAGADVPDEAPASVAAAPVESEANPPPEPEPEIRWQFDSTVMRAQTLLAQLRLYRGPVDGLFGDRTRNALREFQRSAGIPATGELSEPVLAALEQQASAAAPEPSAREPAQPPRDAVVDAAETLQTVDIINECRGKDAEWVYIPAINRHVLCGGLSAQTPNPVPSR